MLESLRLNNPRSHIILKMAIIKRNPETIQPQTRKELGIRISEEILQPLIEEKLVSLSPKDSAHGRSMLVFMAGESSDEVLHTRIDQYDNSSRN
jgi:hypothetical protein